MNQYILKPKSQAFSIQNIKSFASPITILYGGKSGNSAFIAEQIKIQFAKYELEPAVYSMSDYDVSNLVNEKYLFIVVSTRGEGDPPAQAQQFYKFLMGAKVPQLPNLNFSVCALGDSSYQFFCQTGKDIDQQLRILGATRYVELTTCDLAFKTKAERWASDLLNKFQNRVNGDAVALQFGQHALGPTFTLKLKEKYRVSGEKSESEINHLVFQTDHPDFTYQPGDTVSIKPKNPYSLVVRIMIKLGYSHETIVKYKDKKKSIEELLAVKLELTCLTEEVLRAYLEHCGDQKLAALCANQSELHSYLQYADVYDLITDFPCEIEADDFVQILCKAQRRLYSISSSIKETPDEVHLTVKQFNYSAVNRDRIGACSSYLNKGLQLGSGLKVQFIPNEAFRLPADELPVIMIGAGTGIAPYLSFLKERKARGASGTNWLIFGEKQREHDFLYQKELENFKNEGLLTRLDLAFSRDDEKKVYVQDRIKEKGKEIINWLEKGAHIYVCGAVAMGKAVTENLIELFQIEFGMDKEQALAYFDGLQQEARYHEDVY
ncbi:sulfite reductase subunit alpha [Ancylomarina salipaludis]|uniref:assimilatory sulfite reductase (NADPH) n=1 Tax=Ancylomarina salipaludis TaxID=2501299 RepID=A0A4V1MZX7_9BACT|nr:flavodoxin domain-containing protein [Ancylomarina salipaludis]RXQ91484.1 sulfite reductase subunit alpha [Ancylomarina salipaludis]